jgi:hypothetical protein
MWRRHEYVQVGVLLLDLRDDAADRLVDERDPKVLRARHERIL